jgi:hypothetical protein
MALCECGCGQEAPIRQYTQPNRGYFKGQPLRFIPAHTNRGRKWSPQSLAARAAALKGRIVSAETREKISARHRALGTRPSPEATAKSNANRGVGSANASWKGGVITRGGRRCIYAPEHPHARNKYVYEYRLVAEQTLGRILSPTEVVHHIDGDKHNNAPDNLMVISSQAEHMRLHKEEGDLR